MEVENLIVKTKQQINQIIQSFESKITTFRTGRAHPSILKNIKVDCYDQKLPLWEVASVNVYDATSIMVQPFDAQTLPAVQRAILVADLNLNPVPVGDKSLKIIIPPLTTESRNLIGKQVRTTAELYLVKLRNQRRSCIQQVKKLNLGQNETELWLSKIDQLFKKSTGQVDALADTKVKQLMNGQ